MRSIVRRALLGSVARASLMAPALAQISPHQENIFPPWQNGANNDAISRGFDFTVPGADDLADFHGDPTNPQLVLDVGGNDFFAMAPPVQAFEAAHPEYKGRICWETIPPGLLVKQMQAASRTTVGNLTWTAKPHASLAGLAKVKGLIGQGLLTGRVVPYVTDALTITVPRNNPACEGIARQIEMVLTNAGGNALERTGYDAKVKEGSAILTQIYHRQTPLFLMQGVADAGFTWQSEAVFQQQAGDPIGHVAMPNSDTVTAILPSTEVKGGAHPEAVKAWLDFIRSPDALLIFERSGFKPCSAG
jgi:molybdate transport system substrate-binding protein